MKILIEFTNINTREEFEDLVEMLDSIELKYAVSKAPKKWTEEVD